MVRVLALMGLAIVAASGRLVDANNQQPNGPRRQLEAELRGLNDQVASMQTRHDVTTARRLLADDYIFIQADGNVSSKTENIAVIGDPQFACESLVTEGVDVRVYGDTAVITGRAVMKASYKGQDVGGQFRYTDVWVKRRGSWQNVSSQATRLPQIR